MRKLSLAYSPDTDDAFMVEALRTGLVTTPGIEWEFYSADIQELNQAARYSRYDVTAISVAAYATIQNEYLMMPVGASIGQGFGPAIVVRNDSSIMKLDELHNKRIAVPGLQTSAMLAAQALLESFEPIPTAFDQIEALVQSKAVEAGILIHELQLSYSSRGLRSLGNLGALWRDRFQLPLPLGANAIKRSLGSELISVINAAYRSSIEYALAHRVEFVERAGHLAKEGLDAELGNKYIEMYVNQDSLNFSDDVLKAMKLMFDNGAAAGFIPPVNLTESIVVS
jgi:1,4-dihydroxy-6-naphthoate synthase